MVGLHVRHVGGEAVGTARIDHLHAERGQQEAADGVLVGVRQRQEGQVGRAFAATGDQLRARRRSSTGWSGAEASPPWARRRCRRYRSGRRGGRRGSAPLRPSRRQVARRAFQRRPGQEARARGSDSAGSLPCRPAGRGRPPRRRRPAPWRPRQGWKRSRPAPEIAQDMGVVAGQVRRVGRHRHGADRHQRRVGDRVFRAVLVRRSPPGRRPRRRRRAADGHRRRPCG